MPRLIATFIITILLFSFLFIKIDSPSSLEVINTKTDTIGPKIKNNSPSKCQQYIVAKPLININYYDTSGVDISSVKLFINYRDVTKNCTITNKGIAYIPASKFKRGNQIVRIELCDLSEKRNKSIYEWYFTVGTPVYNHYYGLLHSHTSASDGHGTFNDAYYLARDKANLDFFAITDHSNFFDNNLNCTIQDASSSSKWIELLECANKFTIPNEFIALAGFEMTYPYNTKESIGHINVFNTKGFVCPQLPNMNLQNFYMLLYEQEDAIGQFNHPCDKFGKFENLKYSRYGDDAISLIEVENGYSKDLSKNIKSYDMYQLALDNGWHLAPTCNQDNHRVDFAIANELRTVVLATDLSKDALYDSLKKMRVYATEDKNIKIDYTINDLAMGSTIKKASNLNFCISAIDKDDSDKIEEIQVISNNGQIIKTKKFNSNLAKLEFTIKPNKNSFYYVKIIQHNNKISLTAPIWINNK
ncbi:MAG: CehA/McbA family metallohydrolase [Peptostreptococcaceae bacterium]